MPDRTEILAVVGSSGATALLEEMLRLGPIPQSRLANVAEVPTGTASKRLAQLNRVGLVERTTGQGAWKLRCATELHELFIAADRLAIALDQHGPVPMARVTRPRQAA